MHHILLATAEQPRMRGRPPRSSSFLCPAELAHGRGRATKDKGGRPTRARPRTAGGARLGAGMAAGRRRGGAPAAVGDHVRELLLPATDTTCCSIRRSTANSNMAGPCPWRAAGGHHSIPMPLATSQTFSSRPIPQISGSRSTGEFASDSCGRREELIVTWEWQKGGKAEEMVVTYPGCYCRQFSGDNLPKMLSAATTLSSCFPTSCFRFLATTSPRCCQRPHLRAPAAQQDTFDISLSSILFLQKMFLFPLNWICA